MKTTGWALTAVSLVSVLVLGACGEPPTEGGIDAGGSGASGSDASMGQCTIPGWDGEGSPPPVETPPECDDTVVDGDPEEPVSSDPNDPGTEEPYAGPTPVEPQPGQENVRPIGWHKANVHDDDRTVDIIFWSGVEPCYVLDRVEVEYRSDRVIITLFQGSTPSDEDVACIDIALKKQTTIELDEPLADRKITDGAPS